MVTTDRRECLHIAKGIQTYWLSNNQQLSVPRHHMQLASVPAEDDDIKLRTAPEFWREASLTGLRQFYGLLKCALQSAHGLIRLNR